MNVGAIRALDDWQTPARTTSDRTRECHSALTAMRHSHAECKPDSICPHYSTVRSAVGDQPAVDRSGVGGRSRPPLSRTRRAFAQVTSARGYLFTARPRKRNFRTYLSDIGQFVSYLAPPRAKRWRLGRQIATYCDHCKKIVREGNGHAYRF